jgi:hypothetical protein
VLTKPTLECTSHDPIAVVLEVVTSALRASCTTGPHDESAPPTTPTPLCERAPNGTDQRLQDGPTHHSSQRPCKGGVTSALRSQRKECGGSGAWAPRSSAARLTCACCSPVRAISRPQMDYTDPHPPPTPQVQTRPRAPRPEPMPPGRTSGLWPWRAPWPIALITNNNNNSN